ncbi:alcohol oxidase [Dendrothele bispora CBS 962.96]|uniref:Alcohol oxidase n=1 Tax=Dendrothele bispora (strain CBS 962.96) TaxID=1314807 RepID=A0A4S8MUV5_DENBC|nr:alcohol oxidase [Dendrothele bispora CBS 962.96]
MWKRCGGFDFVVCGGGLSGLVVASRLSEDPSVSVAVLEAGGDVAHWPDSQIPGFFTKNLTKPEIDWMFFTTPQAHVNDRSIYVPRGKGIGGSSILNFMTLGRASTVEYDAMEGLSGKGWNWSNYLKYFKKSETFSADPEMAAKHEFKPDPEVYGTKGPLHRVLPRWISQLHMPFYKALHSLGVPHQYDSSNGHTAGTGTGTGAIHPHTATKTSAVSAYYEPAKDRPNFTVIKFAHVHKVLFSRTDDSENLVATGVEYIQDGSIKIVMAKKEVILSAGSCQTPQLLELSGIGDSKVLAAHGIPVLQDLPGVGANLQDHLSTGFTAEMNPKYESMDVLANDPMRAGAEWQLYETKRQGMFTAVSSVAYAFLPTKYFADVEAIKKAVEDPTVNRDADELKGMTKTIELEKEWLVHDEVPQLEIVQVPAFLPTAGYLPTPGKRYFSIFVALMHPLSRGTVHITSPDPLVPPAIDGHFLENKVDTSLLISALHFARKVVRTEELKDIVIKEVIPGERVESDEELERYVKNTLSTVFHPVGTASMLPHEEGGVVDERCMVYGTENLRVVDASIIPVQLAAHTQATVYALAEKAADLIKDSLQKS